MEEILSTVREYVLPHWPLVFTLLVFTVIGQFTSHKVFTRARAYQKRSKKFLQWFWWWGRESLPLHPIASGALLGLLWHNPEGVSPSWPLAASVSYFAGAGVLSLFAWSLLRGYLKKKGIDLSLPGDSTPPPAA